MIQKKLTRTEMIAEGPKLERRYGIKPSVMFADTGDVHDLARSLFGMARKVFERDGYHITLVFLLREGVPIEVREQRPMEHGHKFIMMRTLANRARRIGADAAIMISETWSAPADLANPYMRAVDSPHRRELLTATAVSKNGNPILLSAEILRNNKTLTLADTIEQTNGAHFAFAALYEVWKKPIPVHWSELPKDTDGVQEER